MLANFFGKSNPANFIVIFSIFLGLFLAKSISSISIITVNLVVEQVSILALFLLMFLFYNFILSKNKLTLYNSYGLLLFVLFFGFYPETMSNRNEVFLNVLLLVFLRRVYSIRSGKDVYKKIFDSGFWLGILFPAGSNNCYFWNTNVFIYWVVSKNKYKNTFNSLSWIFSTYFLLCHLLFLV